MKTFEQCCDEVAKKKGYQDFTNWFNWTQEYNGLCQSEVEGFSKEVAKEVAIEAVKLAREGYYDGRSTYSKWRFDYTEQEILEKLGL